MRFTIVRKKNARLANTNSNANTRVASHLQVNRIDLFTLLTRASTIILLPSYREKEIFKHVLKLIKLFSPSDRYDVTAT